MTPSTISYNTAQPDQNIVTVYGYDQLGRLLTIAETVKSMLDRTTSFTYDDAGHLTDTVATLDGQEVRSRISL